jgi:hypothetical protein
MTVITAALIQQEFATSVAATDLEVIINSAIDTVNTDANQSINPLSGSPGTVTVTAAQASAIKPLIAMKLASNLAQNGVSSSMSLGSLSQSNSQPTGGSNLNSELYKNAVKRLIGSGFRRA